MTGDTATNVVMLIARVIAFCTAIPFHEAAHAFVSYKLGDPTAKQMGRLSLNPLRHLDPWGFLAMLVIGIGWAKPVPIRTEYYKNKKAGMAVSAAAGPVSNLLLAYLSMVLYKLFIYGFNAWAAGAMLASVPTWAWGMANVLYYLSFINVVLAVFNLLPIPPFDGSRIFLFFLPERLYFGVMKYERIIMLAVIAFMWFGNSSGVLSTAYGAVMGGMDWATGYLDVLLG